MGAVQSKNKTNSLKSAIKAGLIFLLAFESYLLFTKGIYYLLEIKYLLGIRQGWPLYQSVGLVAASTIILFRGWSHYYQSFSKIPSCHLGLLLIPTGLASSMIGVMTLLFVNKALLISMNFYMVCLSFLILLFGAIFLFLLGAIFFRGFQILLERHRFFS